MNGTKAPVRIAIACGGTGGHLFPGLAVVEEMGLHEGELLLLISQKEVDQLALKGVRGVRALALPAVGFQDGRVGVFARGFWAAWRMVRTEFAQFRPDAVLAMGGFTSGAPVLAGRQWGASVFLHEANTIPGRATRWLQHFANEVFTGFPETVGRLRRRRVSWTGMPVRAQFQPQDAAACRMALGLEPDRLTLVVTGGSQGARGLNQIVVEGLPELGKLRPQWQILHLTGLGDYESIRAKYRGYPGHSVVRPFLSEMELALGAASVVVSRAGASSVAELAAMRVPSILVPLPSSADNHQWHNARAYERSGAARLLEQSEGAASRLVAWVAELGNDLRVRGSIIRALGDWHAPHAAELIAARVIGSIWSRARRPEPARARAGGHSAIVATKPGMVKVG